MLSQDPTADRSAPRARLDAVVAEITAMERRVAELASNDYVGRIDAKERLRDLRIEAARLHRQLDRPASVQQARRELADIERRLAEIDDTHIDVVQQAGGGSTGGDFAFAADAQQLNRHIDAAAGRSELEQRARRLRVQIEEWSAER